MRPILHCHGSQNQEKNLTLVVFILEVCGGLAMKGYDDIEQTGL